MTRINLIRTPAQVQEAHDLLERWRKLSSVLDGPDAGGQLAGNLRHPIHNAFGGILPYEELRTVQVKAATAAMGHIECERAAAAEALRKLGVDPEAEKEEPQSHEHA
jgi:hypothetical protein